MLLQKLYSFFDILSFVAILHPTKQRANKMNQQNKSKIEFDKIFNASIKITVPYVVGYACGSKLGHSAEWIDIITQAVLFWGAGYTLGVSSNFIYNKVKDFQSKRTARFKNNQNSR